MRPHRVLVIDDSRSMRQLIAKALSANADIEVVGFAADAQEGRQAIKDLDPAVVTLDINMPGMDGMAFLEKIMALRPTPVIMVSSFSAGSADLILQALSIGAVGCIHKPRSGDGEPFADLAPLVREAATTSLRQIPATANNATSASKAREYEPSDRIVAIGASAGGVDALAVVIEGFPKNCPPIVITQHMPAMFTQRLAARLDRLCDAHVTEAQDGAPLLPGHIYIAPGGAEHLQIVGKGPWHCRLKPGPEVTGHRPSVDVLFRSVARAAGAKSVGVILTGMGRDGAAGLLEMRQAGADTIGQNEATSFIYGMPRTAFEAGAVALQLPLHAIGQEILSMTKQQRARVCR